VHTKTFVAGEPWFCSEGMPGEGDVALVHQANAEPDLQQTGKRLKGVIAGLVEGTLDLVAAPLEAQHGQQSQVSGP
jgi:hypothetical protein